MLYWPSLKPRDIVAAAAAVRGILARVAPAPPSRSEAAVAGGAPEAPEGTADPPLRGGEGE